MALDQVSKSATWRFWAQEAGNRGLLADNGTKCVPRGSTKVAARDRQHRLQC
jgi:hypothetical protein